MEANQSSLWPQGLVAYGATFRFLVYLLWIGVGGLLVAGIFHGPETRGELIAGIGCWLVLSAITLALHLEFVFVKIKYDDDGIQTVSPWRSPRNIPWSDVTNVRYSDALQGYVVETTNNGDVRCHRYLSGLDGFLAEVKTRISDLAEASSDS